MLALIILLALVGVVVFGTMAYGLVFGFVTCCLIVIAAVLLSMVD